MKLLNAENIKWFTVMFLITSLLVFTKTIFYVNKLETDMRSVGGSEVIKDNNIEISLSIGEGKSYGEITEEGYIHKYKGILGELDVYISGKYLKEELKGTEFSKIIGENKNNIIKRTWWKTGYIFKYLIMTITYVLIIKITLKPLVNLFSKISVTIRHGYNNIPKGALMASKYRLGQKVKGFPLGLFTFLVVSISALYKISYKTYAVFTLSYFICIIIIVLIYTIIRYIEVSKL